MILSHASIAKDGELEPYPHVQTTTSRLYQDQYLLHDTFVFCLALLYQSIISLVQGSNASIVSRSVPKTESNTTQDATFLSIPQMPELLIRMLLQGPSMLH